MASAEAVTLLSASGRGDHLLNVLIAPRLFDIIREMIVGHIAQKWAPLYEKPDVLQVPDVGLNLGITKCTSRSLYL
jgi:hypothetical protein